MRKQTTTLLGWAVGALVAGAPLAAIASITTYAPPAPPAGSSVTYPSVSESSPTSSTPLYGMPSQSGNSLVFSNMNFAAVSTDGSGVSYQDGQINFTLEADPGNFLTSLVLSEFGDFNVTVPTTGTDTASIDPQSAHITVLAENGVAVTPVELNTAALSVSPADSVTVAAGGTAVQENWSGTINANLESMFASDKITEIAVSFDNELYADSSAGGVAEVAKKGFIVTPGGPIPEPATGALLAVAGLLGLRRRRSA